jgi:hypothetical protein
MRSAAKCCACSALIIVSDAHSMSASVARIAVTIHAASRACS